MSNGNTSSGSGCAAGDPDATSTLNPPGQSAITYRLGTQASFYRQLLQELTTQQSGIPGFTTRAGDDPALALCDAWAVVADVLTFYQERIANEGYLRTACQRRSVVELSRTIGYELNPGVAASTYAAFTVTAGNGTPGVAQIPAGTKVQSVPAPGQPSQPFENLTDFSACAAWNQLVPRQSVPPVYRLTQDADSTNHLCLVLPDGAQLQVNSLYVSGTNVGVKPGDVLLLLPTIPNPPQPLAVLVTAVTPDTTNSRTRLQLNLSISASGRFTPAPVAAAQAQPIITQQPLNATTVSSVILSRTWTEHDLSATLQLLQWDPQSLLNQVQATIAQTDPGMQVFFFRQRLGFFGCSAPPFATLTFASPPANSPNLANPYSAAAANWDSGRTLWQSSWGNQYSALPVANDPNVGLEKDAVLERSVTDVAAGSWAVFGTPNGTLVPYVISAVGDVSVVGYGASGKVTGLSLQLPISGQALSSVTPPAYPAMDVRTTTAYVQSVKLQLVPVPQNDPVEERGTGTPAGPLTPDSQLTLDRMVLGLQPGQAVLLSGMQQDAPGVQRSELALLQSISHSNGYTALQFQSALQYRYTRASLTLCANAVYVTHGASNPAEVLGSGDGNQSNQSFVLKRPFVTYVPAGNARGGQSSLTVLVNGVKWQEAPTLYGLSPRSRSFITRTDDQGYMTVTFGDGQSGARPPTGTENLTATYRTGIGQIGNVAAGSLSLLQTRPLGVSSVTNPLAATGGADPETLDQARSRAPMGTFTLGRAVSLQDYQDFAAAFSGIALAQATVLPSSRGRLLHITVAGPSGAVLAESSATIQNLLAALQALGDPLQQIRVQSYQPLLFRIQAALAIDPRYPQATVLAAATTALQSSYAFAQRSLAQPVTATDVMVTLQQVSGVLGVQLQALAVLPAGAASITPVQETVLSASATSVDASGNPQPAQMLLLHPDGISLEVNF